MKLHALAGLQPAEKREAVASIVSASMEPPNGQVKDVEARVAAFERECGMTTAEMVVAFKGGKLEDTADVAQWLIFARIRGG